MKTNATEAFKKHTGTYRNNFRLLQSQQHSAHVPKHSFVWFLAPF